MANASNIINDAMRKLGVLGQGQNLGSDDANNALNALNDMVSSWSVEDGLVFNQTQETFNLTGATSYTIGVGGDFNTTAPLIIESIFTTRGLDYPLRRITSEEYANISTKDTGGIGECYYYQDNNPLATLHIYPAGAGTVTIYSRKPIASFPDLTTDIDIPSSLKRALVFNLAIEMASEYEKEATMTVMQIAEQSKSNYFTATTRNNPKTSSLDGIPTNNNNAYNIYRGY